VTRPETVVYIATSLDGYIARPDGAIDWLGEPEEGEDYGWAEFIVTVDAIIMGRTTFEQVLTFGAWPYEGVSLVVFSSTMTSVPEHLEGRAEVSAKAPGDLLQELHNRGFRRVYVDGGKTIRSFMAADLIDELIITTIPVLIGQGIPLFGAQDADVAWEHVSTETFKRGLVKNRYRRRR
jgi:dihydrofolate reductase